MRHALFTKLFLGLTIGLVLTTSTRSKADPKPPEGFTALFNGKDLTGWYGWEIHKKGASPADVARMSAETKAQKIAEWTADAKKHWSVQKEELVNDGKGAYLTTEKEYGDIELLLEYKTVARADSGIYLRATPQVQIWDYTDPAKFDRNANKGSGGLFNNDKTSPGKDPLVLADKPFGEWNQFRIIQVGERTTVFLNGKLVVDHARMENYWSKVAKDVPVKPLPRKGPILLQTHGGEIRWRNMFIREISPDEATKILSKKQEEGFKSVFNGKDFTGWAGPVENYEVQNGAIFCKPKKGGFIFTHESYDDFIVALEYLTPPGGNNGLAIRYPGKGRPSVDAMCELQVLDDDHPKYAKLDPRQFNGSAYGLAAAHRGYAHPAGTWNFEVVTVTGSTIQVELNGTQIMNVDLSKVTQTKDNLAHPGKDLRSGHFGFCGHNDPVGFRNIRIKRLDSR